MTALLVIGIVVAVLVLIGAALGFLTWFLGWDVDRFMAPRRAAMTEAGERTADRLADFRDYVRLGR